MILLEYAFFVGALLSLLFWFVFFIFSKELRKDMLWISIFIGAYALVFDYFWWNVDWWRPITITGTHVGIEDVITGFSCGGIMAVVYPLLFRKKIKKTKGNYQIQGAFLLILLQLFTLFFITNVLGYSSIYSTTIAYLLTTPILLYLRKDLWMCSVITAIATTIGTIPIYAALIHFVPQYVARTWIFSNLSGILFMGIPIEDLLFFFLLGTFFGPFYWYVTNAYFVDKKRN